MTKQGKLNVQRRVNEKERLCYSDFPKQICKCFVFCFSFCFSVYFAHYKYPIFCK